MSQAEIISEIPKLSHEQLVDCDRAALENFQMLDAMEAEDEKNAAR
jgi:hypothetical protein